MASLRYFLTRLNYTDTNDFQLYIYIRALVTVIRGALKGLYFYRYKIAISVAKNAKIYGGKKNIQFGKFCKIEEQSVIQGISTKGLVFGDNVTVCFGALIRPSGHWGGRIGDGLFIGNKAQKWTFSSN
mgnify:CR=1 FL=1